MAVNINQVVLGQEVRFQKLGHVRGTITRIRIPQNDIQVRTISDNGTTATFNYNPNDLYDVNYKG